MNHPNLQAAGKYDSTMQLIKRRLSKLEQEQVEGSGVVRNKPPLSPTSKLLRDAGEVVAGEGCGARVA